MGVVELNVLYVGVGLYGDGGEGREAPSTLRNHAEAAVRTSMYVGGKSCYTRRENNNISQIFLKQGKILKFFIFCCC